MPRVSIITATYNRPEVLRWAIESVRRQTFTDWEHVIVGDACDGETEALIRSFDDPRLRYVNRERNFGEQSGPNNDGLRLATGELIAYLNHDDLWFADHLATLIAARDRLGAELVYAPPINVDAAGVPTCGATSAKLRYDPSHFVPASLWLLTRELAVKLRGWRAARDIHATNPSQDFLMRAWRKTKFIVCVPHVTALVLASGGRPGAYVIRDGSQHAALFASMADQAFREQLLTRLALDASREAARRGAGIGTSANRAAERVLIAARLHPDAVRNFVMRRPKGHWIDYLRAFRGLAPLPREGKKKNEAVD